MRASELRVLVGAAVCLPLALWAGVIAYDVTAPAGVQNWSGGLGMDFDVNRPIRITKLGCFDHNQDGLPAPIRVYIYNRDTGSALAMLTFSGATGTLVNSSRFLPLPAPLNLPTNFHGSVVAENYGNGDSNGNVGQGSTPSATNSGAGAISFVGGSRYDGSQGVFPANPDAGPANRYHAGTFEFEEPPAGGAGLMMQTR